jgi:hypothetical protein
MKIAVVCAYWTCMKQQYPRPVLIHGRLLLVPSWIRCQSAALSGQASATITNRVDHVLTLCSYTG